MVASIKYCVCWPFIGKGVCVSVGVVVAVGSGVMVSVHSIVGVADDVISWFGLQPESRIMAATASMRNNLTTCCILIDMGYAATPDDFKIKKNTLNF